GSAGAGAGPSLGFMMAIPVGDMTSQGGSKYAGRPICCCHVMTADFLVSMLGCPASSGPQATSTVDADNVANKPQTKRCERTGNAMGNLLKRDRAKAAHGRFPCQSTPDVA